MSTSQDFYDTYHQKNDKFVKKIGFYNFTYYYLLRTLHKAYRLLGRRPVVLDIGCGVGTLALYLSDYSRFVAGIDLSARAIHIAKSAAQSLGVANVRFYAAELQNFKGIFDLVVATEIIEHVPDEQAFLAKIHGSLTSDGLLMLSTPLTDTILVNTRLYKNFDKEVGHLRRYTQDSITDLLQRNNFRVLSLHKTESPLRNLLYVMHLDIIIKFLKGPLVPIFHWFDQLLVPILGASNVIIIAQKV